MRKCFNNIYFGILEVFNISKIYIFLILISAILSSLYKVINIYFVKLIVDTIEKVDKFNFIKLLLIFIAIIIIVNILNSAIGSLLVPKIKNKIEFNLRKKIYKSYLGLDYLGSSEKYDLYYYSIENIDIIANVPMQIGMLINSLLSIIGIFFVFSQYEPKLVIIIVLGVVVSFIATIIIQKISYKISIKNVANSREVDYINRLFYVPDYEKEVRTTNEKIFFSYLNKAYKNLIYTYLKKAKNIAILDFLSKSIISLVIIAVLFLLGVDVMKGVVTFGVFTMLFAGSQQVLTDLNTFFSSLPQIYSLSLKIGRIKEYLSLNSYDRENMMKINRINNVELKNVYFSYNKGQNILDNISINISKSDGILTVIGNNGVGKSTLLSIFLGLILADEGNVFINDTDIKYIEKQSYFDKISIVFQDFNIFSFTIYENLTGMIDVIKCKEDEVNCALKQVGLYDKVNELEKGMHTRFSKEFESTGTCFSKGELQRLALAKAIIKDGDVFILDEPDSFSDVEYKKYIIEFLNKIRGKKIIILITHNNDLLSISDKVYRISKKKIELVK